MLTESNLPWPCLCRLREHGIVLGVVLIKTWGTFVADDIIFGAQLPSILFTFYLLVSSAAIYSGEAKQKAHMDSLAIRQLS